MLEKLELKSTVRMMKDVKESKRKLTKLYFRCCHKVERWVVLVVVECGVVVRNIGQTFFCGYVSLLLCSPQQEKPGPLPICILFTLSRCSRSYAETLKTTFGLVRSECIRQQVFLLE